MDFKTLLKEMYDKVKFTALKTLMTKGELDE